MNGGITGGAVTKGEEDWNASERSRRNEGGDIRQGGGRPTIVPQAPPIVAFTHDYTLNSIVIDVGGRKLYYVLPDGGAYEYAISVGREGFNWTGTEVVSRKQEWPDWHPPAEMRERDRSLPVKMTGGLKNPLGAMALYLGDTLYRIHGTNDAKSIGRAASSGCFRMLNANVLHLASIAEIGTQVTVVGSLPAQPRISSGPAISSPSSAMARPEPTNATAPTSAPERTSVPEPTRQAIPDRESRPASDYRALREQLLRRE
jgi:lipoprotein-anchoring transpeptidase ErfK/SrfK